MASLDKLESWYVWNIYKQLAYDLFEKAADLKYEDIEVNLRTQIIDKIKSSISSDKVVLRDYCIAQNSLFNKQMVF